MFPNPDPCCSLNVEGCPFQLSKTHDCWYKQILPNLLCKRICGRQRTWWPEQTKWCRRFVDQDQDHPSEDHPSLTRKYGEHNRLRGMSLAVVLWCFPTWRRCQRTRDRHRFGRDPRWRTRKAWSIHARSIPFFGARDISKMSKGCQREKLYITAAESVTYNR